MEATVHKNIDMIRERSMGEEGVDYIQSIGDIEDPNIPNEKIFEKQIRREINSMKLTDPETAQAFEDHMFKRNEYDEMMEHQFDLEEVKIYPGSEKGPMPEDDPENYSRWFVENQPKSIYGDEVHDYSDIGAKRKYVQMVRDMSENTEQKTPINYFLEEDEIYPLATYNGQPEFSVFERERYNVENDEELPSVSMSTNMGPNELSPLPSDHTLSY